MASLFHVSTFTVTLLLVLATPLHAEEKAKEVTSPLPANFLDHTAGKEQAAGKSHTAFEKGQTTPEAKDHTTAGTDHAAIASNQVLPGSDHVAAKTDHTASGADQAAAAGTNENATSGPDHKTSEHENELIKNLKTRTLTPEDATGASWLLSDNSTDGKRSLTGLESRVRMFSTERACGFAIQADHGIFYPWMATLTCNNIQCSGTLVSSSLVVTSASCIQSCGTSAVRVRVGDPRLSGCGVRSFESLATLAVVNPRFGTTRNTQFDMGLVQLQTAIDFNLSPFVYPICLVGVETDDPTIECEVALDGNIQTIQTSPVNCYQPGNQLCAQGGLDGITACVRLHQCIPTISTQRSVPVICRRRQNTISASRYYLWGVTTATHASSTCSSGVARISDSFSFLAQGLGFI